jgi:serine/threonine protein kinase/formylglycine-generating enzyme required for sulfatase activity
MGRPPDPDDSSIDSLIEGFLASHPEAGADQFRAWAAEQPALQDRPELISRLARRLAAWPGIEADVQRVLGAKPGGLFRGRRGRAAEAESPTDAEQPLQPGTRVAHFELRRFLAAGGMGQVWEAYDGQLRRLVALKFVRPDRLDTRSLERFEREARAGGRLSHPAIVRTLAFDGASDPAWIAQELVEGSWTLKDFLDELRAEDKTPEGYYKRAAELVASLADGLEAAHQAGVIHRDIKPQNILIAPDDSPKLTDFGLARVADDSFVSVTGDFAGTYYYMSPEQVTAKRIGLDQRTDIFSLGVVLYELLSLRRPFEGDTTHQISQKILFFEPPQPSKIRSQCPRELSVICGKALEKDPDRRYQSMAEFAADLRRHLSNQPILARPPSALVRGLKWARRNPGLSSAAAVGTAALLVISGLLVQQVQTANALAKSNASLEKSNTDLAKQTERAEAGESAAKDNLVLANKNADEARQNAEQAQRNADEATQKANDVLSLSAQKDHDDLVAEAAKLWPAHPERIRDYEDWLRRANELIAGRPADAAKGLKKRLSLAEQKAKLAELRADAKPLSAEQIQAERKSHPRHAELQAQQAELLWCSQMLELDPWPSEASVEAELAQESLPADADALNALAWPLVDPAKPVYGQEVRALLLARRAVDAASEEQRSGIRVTLAWALFKRGRFDEALSEERTALSEPGGEALKSSAADLEQAVASWRGDDLAKRRETRDKLAEEVVALTALVNERRTYEFDDPEQEWWNRQLVKLVSDLEQLRDPRTGLMNDVLAEPFGWGVGKRYAFAKSIGERSVDGPEAKRLWDEAIAAIRSSPKYGGLEIVPQMGLLPIGMDPDSELWEFSHLQTGEPAARGADGKLVLTEGTGLVFVLIPGGTFWMGAQNKPGAQNHDPQAQSDEGPVHEVELSAYFLSKYEMTQGQWERIAAVNPSVYGPWRYSKSWNRDGNGWSSLHPVEQVSWPMCVALMDILGLSLPSEAQWECGARGGTASVYWSGDDLPALAGVANLADAYGKANGFASWPAWEKDHDDGNTVHARVGSFRANAFGLHNVHGNVWEWCLDGYDSGFYGKNAGKDPLSPWSGSSIRVNRGGSFNDAASDARSAYRFTYTPEYRDGNLGLRPSRALRLASSPLHSGK